MMAWLNDVLVNKPTSYGSAQYTVIIRSCKLACTGMRFRAFMLSRFDAVNRSRPDEETTMICGGRDNICFPI